MQMQKTIQSWRQIHHFILKKEGDHEDNPVSGFYLSGPAIARGKDEISIRSASGIEAEFSSWS